MECMDILLSQSKFAFLPNKHQRFEPEAKKSTHFQYLALSDV